MQSRPRLQKAPGLWNLWGHDVALIAELSLSWALQSELTKQPSSSRLSGSLSTLNQHSSHHCHCSGEWSWHWATGPTGQPAYGHCCHMPAWRKGKVQVVLGLSKLRPTGLPLPWLCIPPTLQMNRSGSPLGDGVGVYKWTCWGPGSWRVGKGPWQVGTMPPLPSVPVPQQHQ